MAYSDFTLNEIKKKFQVFINEEINLFADVENINISDILTIILEENVPLALAIHTEKSRSEMIVAPILIEFRKILNHRVSLFSGVEFNVEPEKGLNGVCDFIVSLSKEQLFVSAPVITIVEAKNDNIKGGLSQCAAEMISAKLFNEREENAIETIYGVVTTGSIWKFMKLEKETVYVDVPEYYLDNLSKIIGILLSMVDIDERVANDTLRGARC